MTATPDRSSARRAAWGSELVLPLALFAILTLATWRRSGDPIIDWGRELYVAWRVAEAGEVPPDVVQLFGPLSPEFNGALMRVFGSTMSPILLANLVVLFLAALCVWALCRTLFRSAMTGQLALAAFLLLSGFSQFSRLSSFNFLTPYSHGITHGTTLGLLMVVVLVVPLAREHHFIRSFLAGIFCGLATLTKPEIGVAASLTLVFAAILPASRADGWVFSKLWAAAGVGIVICAAVLYLNGDSGFSVAMATLVAPYATAMSGEIRQALFYRRSLGLDHPTTHLLISLLVLAAYATALGLLIRFRTPLSTSLERLGIAGRKLTTAAVLAAAVTATLALEPMAWALLARPLPLAVLGLLLGYCFPVLRPTSNASTRRRTRARGLAILAVFAFGMLLKLGFHSRFIFYGFALAAPATVLCVGCLDELVPAIIRKRYGAVPSVRTVGRLVVLYLVAMSGILTLTLSRVRDYPIGSGGDRLYLLPPSWDSRSETVAQTLGYLGSVSGDGAGVAFLPEGGILRYLLKSPSATGLASLMPPELDLFGSEAIVALLREGDPTRVVLIERPLDAYGDPTFPPGGRAYRPIMDWIDAHYCTERVFRHSATDNPVGEIRVLRQC